MSVTPVLLVFHNHQPVGNFPWVVEECFHNAYLPFLTVLERHPSVRVGLHFTGALLDWLEAEQPDYLARVRRLVAAGQVEVLGGGLYEPILPVIPERDQLGQLTLMRQRVEALFGRAPVGAWLAERVWEPSLPAVLQAAGYRYVLIDDEAFHRNGYTEQQTPALYITEDQGATLRLLPISRRLRYTLPTKPVETVLQTLRDMATDGADVLVYAEDGERYGSWPGTATYLYGEEAYLERLFTALEEAPELRLRLPADYLEHAQPRGRCYLPPASYTEMLQWSGGFWRNFLTRYRESNLLHKKMYQVSRWVAQAEEAGAEVCAAQRDLYAGQCNCAYWYGAFGGVYLPPLRRALYHHLLRAERAVAPLLPPGARAACEVCDHDCDGYDEVFLRNEALSIGIAPAQGGSVFALESLDVVHNFLDTMGRYPQEGEAEAMPVDWYPRTAFLDHLLPADATAARLRDGQFDERGDFVLGHYTLLAAKPGEVVLRRNGHFWDGPEFVPLQIEKRYQLSGATLSVAYTLTNPTTKQRKLRFALELNTVLSAGDAPDRSLRVTAAEPLSLRDTHELGPGDGLCFRDDWLGVQVQYGWNLPADIWTYPILSPLRTLAGVEWVYQSTVGLPMWEISLHAKESWCVIITTVVNQIASAATMPIGVVGESRR